MDIRLMGEKIRDLLSQIVLAISGLAALGVIAGLLLIFTLLKLSVEIASARNTTIPHFRGQPKSSSAHAMGRIWTDGAYFWLYCDRCC